MDDNVQAAMTQGLKQHLQEPDNNEFKFFISERQPGHSKKLKDSHTVDFSQMHSLNSRTRKGRLARVVTVRDLNNDQKWYYALDKLQEGSQPNGKTPFGEGITWQYEGPLGWRNFVPDNTGSQPSGYTALHFACDGSSRGFDNHGPPSPSSLIWMRAEERLHREAEPEMCSLDVRKTTFIITE